jgi:hypothetical protein
VGTISDNVLDEVRSGTHAKLRYKQELVDVIRQEYAAGAGSTRHLAHKHGVSKSHVHAICAGITRTVRVERRLNERD